MFLLIDEADAIGAARSQEQSHHEDKVAVNTLIQRLDGIRDSRRTLLVILCTNRLSALDTALLRRASFVAGFTYPTESERAELFAMDTAGLGLRPETVQELVRLTDTQRSAMPPLSFSDLRMRVSRAALARAFPDRPVTDDDFLAAARLISERGVMATGDVHA